CACLHVVRISAVTPRSHVTPPAVAVAEMVMHRMMTLDHEWLSLPVPDPRCQRGARFLWVLGAGCFVLGAGARCSCSVLVPPRHQYQAHSSTLHRHAARSTQHSAPALAPSTQHAGLRTALSRVRMDPCILS